VVDKQTDRQTNKQTNRQTKHSTPAAHARARGNNTTVHISKMGVTTGASSFSDIGILNTINAGGMIAGYED